MSVARFLLVPRPCWEDVVEDPSELNRPKGD